MADGSDKGKRKIIKPTQINLCEHISRLDEYLNNYQLQIVAEGLLFINCYKCGGHTFLTGKRGYDPAEGVERG